MGLFSRAISGAFDTGSRLYADKAERDMLTDAARELRDEQWVKNAELLKDQNIQAQADRMAKWNHEDDLLVQKEEIAARAAKKLATSTANLWKTKKEATQALDTQYGGHKTRALAAASYRAVRQSYLGKDAATSGTVLTQEEWLKEARKLETDIGITSRGLWAIGYKIPDAIVGELVVNNQPVPKIPAKELEGVYNKASAELAKINAKLAAATPAAAAAAAATPAAAAAAAAYTPPSLKERGGEVGKWRNNQWYSEKDWKATNAADESEFVDNVVRVADPARWRELADKGQQPASATAPKPTNVSRTTAQEATAGKSNRSAYTAEQAAIDRKYLMGVYQRKSGIPFNPLGLSSLFKPKKQ